MSVASGSLQVTRVQSPAELTPYLEAWRDLAGGAPMRGPEWLLQWWAHFAEPDDDLCLLLLQVPEGPLVGLAPLYLQGRGGRGTVRLLGAANACTHHSDWLAAAGWQTRVGRAVGRFLLSHQAQWQRLLFEAVDADAAALHATLDYLAEHGWLQHRRQIHGCWKIALPATWDDYLGMLSASLRKRCRRLQRQFFDSGRIRLCQATNEAQLQEGFGILLQLHGARWGSARQPLGVFADPRFRAFHLAVSRDLLARRQLRLAWLVDQGRPLAVEYQFVDAKAVYAYQAGVDLSMASCSPGKLSMMAAIQFAIDQGCSSFDLLRGDEPYKANWRAQPVACHDLRLWPKRLRGRLECGLWHGYTLAARRLKPLLPARLVDLGLRCWQALRAATDSLRRRG